MVFKLIIVIILGAGAFLGLNYYGDYKSFNEFRDNYSPKFISSYCSSEPDNVFQKCFLPAFEKFKNNADLDAIIGAHAFGLEIIKNDRQNDKTRTAEEKMIRHDVTILKYNYETVQYLATIVEGKGGINNIFAIPLKSFRKNTFIAFKKKIIDHSSPIQDNLNTWEETPKFPKLYKELSKINQMYKTVKDL